MVVKRPVKKSIKKIIKTPTKILTKPKKLQSKKIERVGSGIPGLDKITGGGFEKNSTNLIVGGTGSGKSILGIQFLLEGVKKGESCLYITFEEEKQSFYKNMLGLAILYKIFILLPC